MAVFGLFSTKKDAAGKKSSSASTSSNNAANSPRTPTVPTPTNANASPRLSPVAAKRKSEDLLRSPLQPIPAEFGGQNSKQAGDDDMRRRDGFTPSSNLPGPSHTPTTDSLPRPSMTARTDSSSTYTVGRSPPSLANISLSSSPIKLDLSQFGDEEEDDRPLGLSPTTSMSKEDLSRPRLVPASSPQQTSSYLPSPSSASDLPPPPSRISIFSRTLRSNSDSEASTRSLPIQSTRPPLSSIFTSPAPTEPPLLPQDPNPEMPIHNTSPTAMSTSSHNPLARSVSPQFSQSSHISTSSKIFSKARGGGREPLLKLSLGGPVHLNPESESKSKLKREKEKEKGGMFSFMRDRKKSAASTPASSQTDEKETSRGNRPSMSSSKSESAMQASKSGTSSIFSDPVIVPPVPALPPLKPIPIGAENYKRPSQTKGFEVPARRGKVIQPVDPSPKPQSPRSPPAAALSSSSLVTNGSGGKKSTVGHVVEPAPPTTEGSFELKAFRHVRAASPGGGRVSPGPFQGLDVVSEPSNPDSRSRQGSIGSEAPNAKTTVAAFRQAQQRRTSFGNIDATILPRRSTADLFEESQSTLPSPVIGGAASASGSQTYLPLPGPPAPPPPILEMPRLPFAGGNRNRNGSPSPSVKSAPAKTSRPSPRAPPAPSLRHARSGSDPNATPPRPPRMRPPPEARGVSPVQASKNARNANAQGRQVKSAYGKLYGATSSSSEESDDEDEEDSDDDVPLGGVVARNPPNNHPHHGDQVSRKSTITQKTAAKKPEPLHLSAPALVVEPGSTASSPIEGNNTIRRRAPGSVIPPPRSSSLFADTRIKMSESSSSLATSPPSAVPRPAKTVGAGPRAISMAGSGGLAGYASSKGSRSMSAFIPGSFMEQDEDTTPTKRPHAHPIRRPHRDSESSSEEDEEEADSSEDDAPLGNLFQRGPGSASSHGEPRSKSALAVRPTGWSASKSDIGHGTSTSKRKANPPPPVIPSMPPRKISSSTQSSPRTATTYLSSSTSPSPAVSRPVRDARRPVLSNVNTTPQVTNISPRLNHAAVFRSVDNVQSILRSNAAPSAGSSFPPQFPSRPFVTAGLYTSSPGGSSNGDSHSSSGRGLPITPRDGSELGTNSGSSAVGVARSDTGHRRKGSVTFEEPVKKSDAAQKVIGEEAKRNERRRSEAKAAIQAGNAINGPPPQVSDDDDDNIYIKQRSLQPPNLSFGQMPMGVGGGMGWDPQLMMMLQQQQMMQAQMGIDPALVNAHHQAMFLAKQAYQLTVAQQAMEAAGEEWERSSHIGGPSGSVISGFGGGGGGLLSGMGGMGMNPALAMGMMTPTARSIPQMNPFMGLGPMGMFTPAPSLYAGSTAGSVYGGGGGNPMRSKNVAFPSSSASSYGGPAEESASASKNRNARQRTNTAPSKGPLPVQHSSRTQSPLLPPPSSWRS